MGTTDRKLLGLTCTSALISAQTNLKSVYASVEPCAPASRLLLRKESCRGCSCHCSLRRLCRLSLISLVAFCPSHLPASRLAQRDALARLFTACPRILLCACKSRARSQRRAANGMRGATGIVLQTRQVPRRPIMQSLQNARSPTTSCVPPAQSSTRQSRKVSRADQSAAQQHQHTHLGQQHRRRNGHGSRRR
jgi:hypothetical protein